MEFGVFVEEMRRGNTQAEAFREIQETVDAAEAWGLDVVWLAEMLFNPARSVLSARSSWRARSWRGPSASASARPCSSSR